MQLQAKFWDSIETEKNNEKIAVPQLWEGELVCVLMCLYPIGTPSLKIGNPPSLPRATRTLTSGEPRRWVPMTSPVSTGCTTAEYFWLKKRYKCHFKWQKNNKITKCTSHYFLSNQKRNDKRKGSASSFFHSRLIMITQAANICFSIRIFIINNNIWTCYFKCILFMVSDFGGFLYISISTGYLSSYDSLPTIT